MILHGSGSPKIILDYGGSGQTTIILPYCDSLIEKFEPEIYQVKLYNGTIDTRIAGWWYSAILDYSSYMATEDIALLQSGTKKLFTTTNRGIIRLYPYNSSIYYEVELDQKSDLTLQHRPFNMGLSGVKLNFVGTNRITTLDLTTTS